jgi:hypothetical protein
MVISTPEYGHQLTVSTARQLVPCTRLGGAKTMSFVGSDRPLEERTRASLWHELKGKGWTLAEHDVKQNAPDLPPLYLADLKSPAHPKLAFMRTGNVAPHKWYLVALLSLSNQDFLNELGKNNCKTLPHLLADAEYKSFVEKKIAG